MRKIIAMLILLIGCTSFAQEKAKDTATVAKKPFRFEPSGRIEVIYPIQFGDHALADAHQTVVGYGLSLSFFNLDNFRFIQGFDRVQYKVSDHQLVGNFRNSNYTSIYFAFSYEVPISRTFSVLPDVGIGWVNVAQKSPGKSFGTQEGTEFRFGLCADYQFDKHFAVFVSGRYIFSNLHMNTNAGYEDYFGKATQLQLALGLKIN